MNNKVILTTALCLSVMTSTMAQSIMGKVVDTKGEPLAFANVVLLNRQDSAFVKGAVSGEDGSFSIDSVCNGGIIKVTSVGYKTSARIARVKMWVSSRWKRTARCSVKLW